MSHIRTISLLACLLLVVLAPAIGAPVLAALADAFEGKSFQMLQVVNPMRPFTDTVKGCLKMRSEIEAASKMTINGIVGNSNLIDETKPENVYNGYEFVKLLSEESGLALKFITAPSDLMTEIDISRFSCPVLKNQSVCRMRSCYL